MKEISKYLLTLRKKCDIIKWAISNQAPNRRRLNDYSKSGNTLEVGRYSVGEFPLNRKSSLLI